MCWIRLRRPAGGVAEGELQQQEAAGADVGAGGGVGAATGVGASAVDAGFLKGERLPQPGKGPKWRLKSPLKSK
jgi:hypothetical protein